MNNFVGEIINAKVSFNEAHGKIAVPKLMLTYKDDFCSTDGTIIEFIYKYLDNPEIEMSQAL